MGIMLLKILPALIFILIELKSIVISAMHILEVLPLLEDDKGDSNMALDYFGRSISEGDVIVYPVRQGSSMWIDRARVLEVLPDKLRIEKRRGVKTQIKNIGNCIIAPENTEL